MKVVYANLPEGITLKEFKSMFTGILQMPVNSRTAFSSIRRIERALENEAELELEKDDSDFVNSQLDYGLQSRMLQNPKKWEVFFEAIAEKKKE